MFLYSAAWADSHRISTSLALSALPHAPVRHGRPGGRRRRLAIG
jgi:hypothetical protein